MGRRGWREWGRDGEEKGEHGEGEERERIKYNQLLCSIRAVLSEEKRVRKGGRGGEGLKRILGKG